MKTCITVLSLASVLSINACQAAEPVQKVTKNENALGSTDGKTHLGNFANALEANKKLRPMIRENRHAQDEIYPLYTDVVQQIEPGSIRIIDDGSREAKVEEKKTNTSNRTATSDNSHPRMKATQADQAAPTTIAVAQDEKSSADIKSKREGRKDIFTGTSTRILQFFGKTE